MHLYSLLDLEDQLSLLDLDCQLDLEVLVRLEDLLLEIRRNLLSSNRYKRIIRMELLYLQRILDLAQLKKVSFRNVAQCL